MSKGSFHTTRWTDVERAAQSGPDGEIALSDLLVRYQKPLLSFLLRRTRSNESDAEDLLQSFIADKILQRNILARANRSKGRFRNFLLKSLDRFVQSQWRGSNASKRRPVGGLDSIDNLSPDDPALSISDERFDELWAGEIVEETLSRMKADCMREANDVRWEVFRIQCLEPILAGTKKLKNQTLMNRLNLENEGQVSNLLNTAKRMYRRILREVISEYEHGPVDVDVELLELRRIFSLKAGS